MRGLYKSENRVLFGVCGGIAQKLDLAPLGVRIGWVLMTLVPPLFPVMIIGYIALALMMKPMPEELVRERYAQRPDPAQLFADVQRRSDALNRRLARMESFVTSPGFELKQLLSRTD